MEKPGRLAASSAWHLTETQVAERAGIARSTLQLTEQGEAGVAMSSYLQVLFVLGLEKD